MTRLVLAKPTRLSLNSDLSEGEELTFEVVSSCRLVVEIDGQKPFDLKLSASVAPQTDFTVLLVNNLNAPLKLKEDYALSEGAHTITALSTLGAAELDSESNYTLASQSELRVLTVSATSQKKSFHQSIVHQGDGSKAQVDNYGVVLANGDCRMVVANRIERGIHDCQTHQNSRLLTFDESSKARILPILYIDDNEVAASHACSLGQPDEEQIYYLMSRGLNRQAALRLITSGYLMPITAIVDDEEINALLRKEIEEKVMLHA